MSAADNRALPIPTVQTRRRVLAALSLAGGASLLGAPRVLAASDVLETRSVRFMRGGPATCIAPTFAAEAFLRADGFSDIRYLETPAANLSKAIAQDEADFSMGLALNHIEAIDAGLAITVLCGVHVGCYELFALNDIRSISELKGKTVGLKASPPDLLRLIALQVGLDPEKDFRWVIDPKLQPLELFAAGKIDAFLGFPPEPQELRARHAGHVLVSITTDRPWSQYFCCMLTGNRRYVHSNPVATKRVLRAILKATDLCVTEPARIAQSMVDRHFTDRYDYALQTLTENPYGVWRSTPFASMTRASSSRPLRRSSPTEPTGVF
jgi:NitT/TauT family transport system substrate-binding protein